ncbi:hypothetical protein AX17_007270 [Amanita inopinata Kibby_2008]|nr:hypothetical protein AX17_007270 [Amanita inopinata Kibby_2008]
METAQHSRTHRTRGASLHDGVSGGRKPHSRNKQWVASENGLNSASSHVDGERWERGGHRGGRGTRGAGRGLRRFPNVTLHVKRNPHLSGDVGASDSESAGPVMGESDMEDVNDIEEPELETQEEREKFYQELVKAREVERKKAIAEGKMDDPLVPKRLEDAITMVGTCMDMCPRFERYRRERENNLFERETIPGTKRVDHRRAVKMYERAAGDKTLPSDLRPPHVLKRTLDYLFHDLLPRGGFSATFNFIRDRSRAVRNDFTMQHQTGPLAIECHDRCARFHILALHSERNNKGFSIALEEQQLMNTLQSLKEFYEDQRGRYQSPTELEMRVYHRLIHIRDQRERHEDIPDSITSHPVFKLTTAFRLHVQKKSAPINKVSSLIVDEEGMKIFAQLAGVLREQGNLVMIYLVACILERHFGVDTIDDIESIRGDLSIPDIIDGVSSFEEAGDFEDSMMTDMEEQPYETITTSSALPPEIPVAQPYSDSKLTPSTFLGVAPGSTVKSFSNLSSSPNAFGTTSVFGTGVFAPAASTSTVQPVSAFSSVFGGAKGTSTSTISSAVKVPQDSGPSRPTALESKPLLFGKVQTSDQIETSREPVPEVNANNIGAAFAADSVSSDSGFKTLSDTLKSGNAELPKPSILHTNLNPAATAFVPLTPSKLAKTYPSPSSSKPPVTPPMTVPASAPVESPSLKSDSRLRQLSNGSGRRLSIVLPKIDTSTIFMSPGRTASSMQMQPPPLAKKHPISLPSTPTTAPPPSQPSLLLSHVKTSLGGASNSSNDILSPLPLASPSGLGLVQNFSPVPSPSKAAIDRKPQRRPSTVNGKGKEKEVENGIQRLTHEEARAQAGAFAQKGLIVKQCFERWKQRVIDHAVWLEACRQSDSYRQKIRSQRKARAEMPEKKRRISLGTIMTTDTSPKKRIRRRISNEYQPPRTDEQLAQRLKENHEEHAHRWARGSFLQALKSHVRDKAGVMPASWQIWLSTNPDSDATAIWMERKFDVPDSGYWVSENIFSIPLSQSREASKRSFPGLVVFECTPIQNVKDDIERKYHILDDCARLREIIKALPSRRHYIPSLLIIRWEDGGKPIQQSDFLDMVQKLVDDSVIGDAHVFPVTSEAKNLDVKFREALASFELDVTGKLVQPLNVQDLFKRFEPALDSFAAEWIENCTINGEFDWTIYAETVQAVIKLVNNMATSFSPLLAIDKPCNLPVFDSTSVDYSDAAYESAYSWLEEIPKDDFIERVAQDLRSHHEIGQEFPARIFLSYILGVAIHYTEARTRKGPGTKYLIFRSDLAVTMESLKASLQSQQTALNHILNKRLRRSPKRRGLSEGSDLSFSISAKRRRLSESVDEFAMDDGGESVPPSPQLNGRPSPSPSVSTISLAHGDQPRVTVAMLRALTKDLKQKYTQ